MFFYRIRVSIYKSYAIALHQLPIDFIQYFPLVDSVPICGVEQLISFYYCSRNTRAHTTTVKLMIDICKYILL